MATAAAPAEGHSPTGGSDRAPRGTHGERPRSVLTELALALPPTLTVLAVMFGVEALWHERVLFASLASSAFLIYRDPRHRMNDVQVMVTAHVVGVLLGVGTWWLLQPGYVAGAVAMTGTIILLILLDAVHPPAVSTALGFAFLARQAEAAGAFLLALVMLAALVVMQRAALWVLHHLHLTASRGAPLL